MLIFFFFFWLDSRDRAIFRHHLGVLEFVHDQTRLVSLQAGRGRLARVWTRRRVFLFGLQAGKRHHRSQRSVSPHHQKKKKKKRSGSELTSDYVSLAFFLEGGATRMQANVYPNLSLPFGYISSCLFGGLLVFCGFNTLASKLSPTAHFSWIPSSRSPRLLIVL
jgi:hypothetical protein